MLPVLSQILSVVSNPTTIIVLKQFILGSSLLGTFSSLSFLNNFDININNVDKFKSLNVMLPLLLGVGSIVAFFLFRYIKSQLVYLVVGGVFGLLMTLYGDYVLKLTPKVFGFDEDNKMAVYGVSMAIFAVIFFFVLKPLASMIL